MSRLSVMPSSGGDGLPGVTDDGAVTTTDDIKKKVDKMVAKLEYCVQTFGIPDSERVIQGIVAVVVAVVVVMAMAMAMGRELIGTSRLSMHVEGLGARYARAPVHHAELPRLPGLERWQYRTIKRDDTVRLDERALLIGLGGFVASAVVPRRGVGDAEQGLDLEQHRDQHHLRQCM